MEIEPKDDALKYCQTCDVDYYANISCATCYYCGTEFDDPSELPEIGGIKENT